MAYIESHQELARHPKTKKAARLLNISIPQMIGHLHMLWYWAMDYAQDGDLARYEPADIAEATLWEGDPQTLLDILTFAGFLEIAPKADQHKSMIDQPIIDLDQITYRIHDWMEYAGKLILKRQKDAKRHRDARLGLTSQESPPIPQTSIGHPHDGAGTVPNRTQPNQTILFAPKPDPPPARDLASSDASASAPQKKAFAKSQRGTVADPWWGYMATACGHEPAPAERGAWLRAIKDIKAMQGIAEDIPKRAERYRARYPDMRLSASALAKHWPELITPEPKPTMTPQERRHAEYAEHRRLAQEMLS